MKIYLFFANLKFLFLKLTYQYKHYVLMEHEHDPWNPNGCSACIRAKVILEDKAPDISADEWKIYQSISLIVPNIFHKAMNLWQNKKYDSAKSYFNKTLLIVEEKCKSTTELNKYPIDRLAAKLRAEIFQIMGNSAHSLCDYITTKENFEQVKLWDERTHPSIHSLIKCNSNTLQMVEFAKKNHGWIKISAIDHKNILPKKFGHCMIEYNGKLYVFGGASDINKKHSNKTAVMLIEITITKINKEYKYKSKSLPFPRSLRQYIFDKIPIHCDDPVYYTNMLTTVKWKHYMIIFGGNNYPFRNMLQYDLKNKKWSKITVSWKSGTRFLLRMRMLVHHSAVIMHHKMYIYGGCIEFIDYKNNTPVHLLAYFDLIRRKWSMCGQHKDISVNSRVQGIYNIPEPRFDHCMWTDVRNNSIYVGFGSYSRDNAQHLSLPPQRLDIWRYDTLKKTNAWTRNETLNGNIPLARSESGYCNTLSEFYLFGGYTTQIGFYEVYNGQSDYHRYVYLGDF
eukprot:201634_1